MQADISLANWDTDSDDIKAIRQQVFIDEQLVPEEMEWDDQDQTAMHCLARIDGKPVATARLQEDGQLGRMAVLKTYRKHGIGRQMLQFLIEQHQLRSNQPLIIHAQTHAVNFYQKFGFIKQGNEYDEAGIPHYTMILKSL